MALVLQAGGVTVPVFMQSITYEERVDQRATCTFTIMDSVGYSLSQLMIVNVTDSATSTLLYLGYIDKVDDTKLPGASTVMQRIVTCKDLRYLAEKRTWTGPEFDGWTAGDIAAEVHRVLLAAEGVTAAYALRHDNTTATLGAGTLAGTSATNNTLTLAPSGADFTRTDAVTADFNTGTLTSVVGVNNGLSLVSSLAIKYTGSVGADLDATGNNFSAYRKIWGGSYTLATGDLVVWDQWISSTSPEIKCSLDLLFSDGTWYHDDPTEYQDQYNIECKPDQDLKGWADDQWMHRSSIVQVSHNGKVAVGAYLVFEGEKAGDYTAYFKQIKITNSTGTTVKRDLFSGADTQMLANVAGSASGYYNLSAKVIKVYEQTGVRLAPSRSITGVGIVKGSIISWIAIPGLQPTGGNSSTSYPPQVLVETSFDGGATYQPCSNHGAIPLLPTGLSASGVSILVRQTLAVGGSSPETSPFLDTLSFTVFSAPAATKSDVSDIDNTTATLGAGSLTNCTSYSDGLYTTGSYRNWDDLSVASQTVFGDGAVGGSVHGEAQKHLNLRTDPNSFVASRFDFAGTWQNFILEVDIQIPDAIGNLGIAYRTTAWNNINNTYAYCINLQSTSMFLGRGTNNGGPGSFSSIGTATLALTVGTWYRLKMMINGSSHQFYINDTLFLTVTDATYSAAGNVAAHYFSGAITGRQSGYFDNFSIIGYASSGISTCSRTTAGTLLTPVGTVGSSLIAWGTNPGDDNGQLLVESTIDNGTTWNTCTNWTPIPLLVAGFNASGKTLKIRATMTNQNVNLPVKLTGLAAWVVGQYSASGTRISPALLLTPAGTTAFSSVSWVAAAPVGTTVGVDTSLTGIGSWTAIAASGNPAPGLTAQGVLTADDYITNTAAQYTGAFFAGGAAPTFAVDTFSSQLNIKTGTNAYVLWNTAQFPTAKDVSLEIILNQCDNGGLTWRYTSVDNNYYCVLRDGGASANANTLAVHKRVAGVDTTILAATALPGGFIRGTYHALKVTMAGTTISVFFDGLLITAPFTDASLAAAGQVGHFFTSTSGAWQQIFSLRAQALGASASGVNLYTRVSLTSTDPTVSPVLSDLVLSVRGPDLATGALIPATQYAYQKNAGAIIDDVAGQSDFSWRIDKNAKKLILRDRSAVTAAWPLYSGDPLYLGTQSPAPVLSHTSPLYRNRQYVRGAVNLQTVVEKKPGDGSTQSWPLSYPIDSITSISLDGDYQTVGIQGAGQYYSYTVGQTTFAQDPTQVPPTQDQMQVVTYVGRVPYTAMRENTGQQTALAAIDSSSGIVEMSEDCGGLPAAAADAIAQARIDKYAILSRDWVYPTQRVGLAPGTIQSMFVPEHGLNDVDMLISGIKTTIFQDTTGALFYQYDVSATEGPNIGTWQRLFANALTGG